MGPSSPRKPINQAPRVGWAAKVTEATSEIRGTSSVHVFVVDEEGDPVTGQDVTAHFSSARVLDKMYHQYTDTEGHAEFLRDPAAEPLRVTFFVRGQSCGPYTIENGAKYTVEISRE